jgi:hypothetical protein
MHDDEINAQDQNPQRVISQTPGYLQLKECGKLA